VSSRVLPIDRVMADRAALHLVPNERSRAVPTVTMAGLDRLAPYVAPTPPVPPALVPTAVAEPAEPVEPAEPAAVAEVAEVAAVVEAVEPVEVAPVTAPAAEVETVAAAQPEPQPEPVVEPAPVQLTAVELAPVDLAPSEVAAMAAFAGAPEPEPAYEVPAAIAEVLRPIEERQEHDPAAPETISLAVAGQPLRFLDPEVEHALDQLARAAREEILSANAPEAAKRDKLGEEHWPWLTNMRKAWEPPAEHPGENRSRWSRFRRTG
jgi:hypothetical protein